MAGGFLHEQHRLPRGNKLRKILEVMPTHPTCSRGTGAANTAPLAINKAAQCVLHIASVHELKVDSDTTLQAPLAMLHKLHMAVDSCIHSNTVRYCCVTFSLPP